MIYFKILFLICFISFSHQSFGDQETFYIEGVDAKKELSLSLLEAKKKNSYLLLDFGANYCPDCRQLSRLFKTREIKEWLNKRLILLPIDVGMSHEINRDISRKYGDPVKSGIPSLVLLDSSGEMAFATKNGELARARNVEKVELLTWLKLNLGPLLQ